MVGHVHQHASTAPAAESVWTFFSRLFHAEFVPRAQCYLLQPELIWLHVISDGLIAAAYFSIPLALIYFVKRRKDLAFHWMFILFAIFILACGTTHLFNILAVWHPMYRLDGVVKGATAVASVGTAIALWPLIPAAIALPSPEQLRTANTSLGAEVERRRLAEEALRRAHDGLEEKVRQRTSELARSEDRYRSLVEASAQVVWSRGPDGRMIEDQPSWRAFTGQSAREMAEWGWLDAIHPEDRERVVVAWREALVTGGPISMEYRLRRADGVFRTTAVRAVPVREGDGVLREWVGMNTDVTELRLAEEALRDGEARKSAILESALDCIITIGSDGAIIDFNPAAERTFGYGKDAVVGRRLSEVIIPQRLREAHERALGAVARGEPGRIIGRRVEMPAIRAGGEEFPVELAISAARTARGEPFFTAYLRDITERKQAEEALARHRDHLNELVEQRTAELSASHARLRASERMASMGTLAAGLGHDLGNLLLPVRVRLERLAEEVPPQLRDDVATIRESTKYLGQLANGLRLLARDPESDAATMETIELEEWWGGVAALMRSPLAGGVKFEVRLAAELPRVRIGRSSLTQAVFNLVQNAGDALRAGGGSGGTVQVWAEASSDGESVRVGVTDDGPGMSEEVRSRCLEPFYSTKTRGISTGLGLSLVKGIAERAGGSVSIRSAPGEGTTVSISLPALVNEGADGASRDAAVSVADLRVRSFVSLALGPLGFAVSSSGAPGPATLLWVVDGSVPPDAISAFLDADQRRRVLVYGTPPAGLADTRLSSMEAVFQATAIREALTRAAKEATRSL